MPHNFGGGFYTTSAVAAAIDTNHKAAKSQDKPLLSGAGQNTDNQKTEANDSSKQ